MMRLLGSILTMRAFWLCQVDSESFRKTKPTVSVRGSTVAEAAELLLRMPAGTADEWGAYPPDSLFGRVAARLDEFDRILAERVGTGLA